MYLTLITEKLDLFVKYKITTNYLGFFHTFQFKDLKFLLKVKHFNLSVLNQVKFYL